MTFEPEPLGQSRADLAQMLRELRKQAGLTGDRLSRRCNMSQSQISKFETGKKTPKLVDVERILRALDVPAPMVAEIMALARIANTEWQGKRSSWRRGMEKRQTELASLEREATELRYFLPAMITACSPRPNTSVPACVTPWRLIEDCGTQTVVTCSPNRSKPELACPVR